MKVRLLAFFMVFVMIFILVPVIGFALPADVATFAQFKSALEDPNVTEIRLISSIQMEKNKNITINPNKASLVIEGNNNQIIQADSSSSSYSIQFDSSKSQIRNITIQNIRILGKSKNGLVYIPNSSKYSDFTVNFNNITFVGPELICAKYSNVIIKDSNITVVPGYCDSTSYLAEACNIALVGKVRIDKESPTSCRTLFNVASKGSMTIAQGADVTILNNTNSSDTKKSGFIYFTSSYNTLRFEKSSIFNYYGTSAFTYGYDTGTVYIGEGAEVNVTISGNLYKCDGLISVKDTMTIENNSIFKIVAVSNTNSYPVIEFQNKSKLLVNSPREVLIYNSSTKACNKGLAIASPCLMDIAYNSIHRLEYWIKNSSPYTNLRKADYRWENLVVTNPFSAYATINCGKPKSASINNYTGTTPFTTTTASIKDVNVIHISGRAIVML